MLLHDIQLTVIDLSEPPHSEAELVSLLSPDERERAKRFRSPRLQQRFRVGRGMLRLLLGDAANAPPGKLAFIYSPQGKPSLRDFPELHFNLSHSGDLWACGISSAAPLGLDIEQIRKLDDFDGIAHRFFTPAEYNAIREYPEDHRHEAFFRYWTRKEAYLKALGDGLSRGLATFNTACGVEGLSPIRDTHSPHPWLVRSFTPAPGYTGALALPAVAA